jgi:ATP-binding cassette subfamily B protein
VLLWVGANDVLNAHLTPGELMSCNALAGYIVPPIISMITMNANLRETAVATQRLYEILDLEIEKDTGSVEIEEGVVEKIGLVRVVFHYPGRLPILRSAGLTFEKGTITALVGESGCGKSSLLSLLVRLHEPQSGNIYINDINIKNFSLASLRRSICLVPQKVDLFSGSIVDNLAPGDERPDLPRLINLCKQVGLSDFIESLPLQYNTLITENGTNFSGGQKQRMAIVRALYSGASAFLFDEPSSALDSASRSRLIAVLQRLKEEGSIVIVSTHDAALVAMADRIVALANGQFTITTPERKAPEIPELMAARA